MKINNSNGTQQISQNRTNHKITNTIKPDKNGYSITRTGKKKNKKILKTSLNTDTNGVHEQCIRTDKAVGQIFRTITPLREVG